MQDDQIGWLWNAGPKMIPQLGRSSPCAEPWRRAKFASHTAVTRGGSVSNRASNPIKSTRYCRHRVLPPSAGALDLNERRPKLNRNYHLQFEKAFSPPWRLKVFQIEGQLQNSSRLPAS